MNFSINRFYLLTYVTSASSYFVSIFFFFILFFFFFFYKTHDLCNMNQWGCIQGSDDRRFTYGVFDGYVGVYGGVVSSIHNLVAEGSREKNFKRAMVMQIHNTIVEIWFYWLLKIMQQQQKVVLFPKKRREFRGELGLW